MCPAVLKRKIPLTLEVHGHHMFFLFVVATQPIPNRKSIGPIPVFFRPAAMGSIKELRLRNEGAIFRKQAQRAWGKGEWGRPRAGENMDGNKKHVVFVGLQSTTHIIESHTLEQVKIKKSGMNKILPPLKLKSPFETRMVKPQFYHHFFFITITG